MKNKIFLILLTCLLLVSSSKAFAQYGVDVTLTEPNTNVISKGSDVVYNIDVKFTEPLDKFNNLFVTLRFDEGLEFINSTLKGASPRDGSFEAYSKPNEDGRKGFLTIRLTNMAALEGKTSFSVDAVARVLNSAKIGSTLKNRVTVSFQLDGQVNDAKYYQIDQESKVRVSEAGTKEVPKPVDNKKPETLTKPVEGTNIPEQILKTKTSTVYTPFMKNIEGLMNKENKLQVKFVDQVETISPNEKGSFTIRIPAGYHGDIILNSLGKSGTVLKTMTIKYVDEMTMTDTDLNKVIEALRDFGYRDIVDRMLNDFKAYTNQMSVIIGVEGGTYQEMYKFFERLYDATKSPDTNASIHQPFMQGYPDGTFLPGNSIKRSETAAILSRIIQGGEVEKMKSSFPDVPDYEWYTKYIAHLEKLGLMKGYEEDGTFRPDNKITRAEFAAIVSRYLSLRDAELISFPDIPSDHWAITDIMKVVNAGIMQGYPDGTFGPQKYVTRAEAATIINRMLGRVPDEAFIKANKITGFKDIKDHWAYYQIVEATCKHNYEKINGLEKYRP